MLNREWLGRMGRVWDLLDLNPAVWKTAATGGGQELGVWASGVYGCECVVDLDHFAYHFLGGEGLLDAGAGGLANLLGDLRIAEEGCGGV